ncbi:hypothetical protein B484DRAFT_304414, partial [Ochromonadaceae sp. CCMP2298]
KANVKVSGYGNLATHVRLQHPDWKKALEAKHAQEEPTMLSYLTVNTTVVDMYRWIDLVVNADLPCSCVDNPIFRKSVKMRSFTSKTLKKYMRQLHNGVNKKISDVLPEHFGIVYDGW